MPEESRTARRLARRTREDETLRTAQRYGRVLFALAAVGFALSAYLSYIHFRHRLEPDYASACAVTPSINCDTVLLSPYGSLAGVPLAVFGMWFYGLSALVAASVFRNRRARFPRSAPTVLLVMSALASVLSVALAVVSVAALRALCIVCGALYGVNIAMLAVSFAAVHASGIGVSPSISAEWNFWKTQSGAAAAWWAKAFAALAVLAVAPRAMLAKPELCNAILAAKDGRSGPVALIVYSDFQCPRCKTLHSELRSLRLSPTVSIVARHYPLDRECNQDISTTMHVGSCLQARAAICAGEQGLYDDYSDRLFAEGPSDESALRRLAVSLGLDLSRFEACLASEKTAEALQADIEAAIAAGIEGTPSILVNGTLRLGGLPPEELSCLRSGIGS